MGSIADSMVEQDEDCCVGKTGSNIALVFDRSLKSLLGEAETPDHTTDLTPTAYRSLGLA